MPRKIDVSSVTSNLLLFTQEQVEFVFFLFFEQKKRSFNLRQKSILKSVDNLSPKTIAAVSPIKRDREMNRTKSVTFAFR